MFSKIKKAAQYFSLLKEISFLKKEVLDDLKSQKINLGQIQSHLNLSKSDVKSINEVEFKVFSQWGDDGIIQYLVNKIEIPNKTFIEFGVENYRESNTRFLLINNKWHGMVIDGSNSNIEYIRKDNLYWASNLYAKHAFITTENINSLLTEFLNLGYNPEVGLLSIDIDGNDYWIWEKINVINPVIVIVEYNAVFGSERAISIPYKSDFNRFELGRKGQLYYGASLSALKHLAEKKNYTFLGANSNGNNVYFVRNDKVAPIVDLVKGARFWDSSFREYMDETGLRVGGENRVKKINGMDVINVINGKQELL